MATNVVVQLIIALSVLIILHELGHFLAARLFKVRVEEFGIGIPPRALSVWRGKGTFHIGSTAITVPAGRRLLQNLEIGQWVDALVTKRAGDEKYVLQRLEILNPETDHLEKKRELTTDGSVHMRGIVTAEALATLYSFNWLPLGGFVRLKGETEADDSPDSLHAANPWARLSIFAAGPVMNLIAAVLIYAVIFTQTGAPDYSKVLVVGIQPDSPAEQAGLQAGDLIVGANGTEIESIENLHNTIYANLGESITIRYQRDGEVIQAQVVPRDPPPAEGAIGIAMRNPTRPINITEALSMGSLATYQDIKLILTLPAELIRGSIEPKMARPVGFYGMGQMLEYVNEQESPVEDAPINLNVLSFFAWISMTLGVLNLLPIPALDGGRILFTLPEILFRRRVSMKWQSILITISFTALIALMIYINLLDFINPIQLPQ